MEPKFEVNSSLASSQFKIIYCSWPILSIKTDIKCKNVGYVDGLQEWRAFLCVMSCSVKYSWTGNWISELDKSSPLPASRPLLQPGAPSALNLSRLLSRSHWRTGGWSVVGKIREGCLFTNICLTHRCRSLSCTVFLWWTQSELSCANTSSPPGGPGSQKILIWSEIAVSSKQT